MAGQLTRLVPEERVVVGDGKTRQEVGGVLLSRVRERERGRCWDDNETGKRGKR